MRLKLSLLLVFIITYSWSQSGSTKTFTGNGTFLVPAGVTSIQVQAWGGGGSGGGASGSPLLLGRGAAGGGGGAYASNTILVTTGTTLNVVVASQTSGTTGAGAAGGNSTITGFESSILAAGGSGGDANNAGGSPLGGVGGTIASSAGSVRFAGANGGNGNSWNLLGLLLSSGPGGAGASSGGAGGTAVSGLLLSNAPGNAGSPPGGAGSGAINSALGASQIGGAGAAGRVIISYSCANFSLTSTAATNVCTSAGTTATVTLTGSAASLPVGNYVVTYNRSSPSATALTANLTVSTAGTGTFTAVGLTTAGSSIITITKLASETCSSNISSNNTATVIVSPATVGGTVSGGTTINAGSTSGLLTLSGHTGSVVKWQSAVSPFTTWTDIANTTATYTSGILTETTQFRAVVKSGLCDAVNSAATTVTVISLPTIVLATSATSVCSSTNAQNTTLNYSGTTGTPTTYSIVWNSSPTNSFVPVIDAALSASPITINVPAGTGVGSYTGTLTVKNASGGVSSGSTFTLDVIGVPTITTGGTIHLVCASTNTATTSLVYSAISGGATSYSIDWDAVANAAQLADQSSTSFAFAPGGGTIDTIQISANAVAGTYSGTLFISNGSCTGSHAVSINIAPQTVGGTASGGTSVCSGSTSGLLTVSGYVGTIGQWEFAVSPFTIFSPVPNAVTTNTYTSVPLTETTQFRAFVYGDCGPAVSTTTTVTVSPAPTITAAASAQSVCISPSVQNTTLSYSGTTGSPITYSIVWNSSPENSFEAVTDATLSGSNIIISVPAETAVGTYTGTLTVKNADGCVSSGSVFTVTVNDLPSIGTFGVMYSVCTSTNAQTGSLEYSFASGNPTSYSIDWDSAANAALLADQPYTPFAFQESGTIDTIVIPANVPGGTYHGTFTLSNGGCFELRAITLNVSPTTVGGTVSGGTTVCSGNTSGELTLSDHTGSIINWQSSVSPFTTWTDIDNTEATYTSDALTETTQFRAVIQSGECNVVNSEATTVTVGPSPSIVLQQPFEVCLYNDVPVYFDIPFSGVIGSPVSFSVVWDEAASIYFDSETDLELNGDSILMTSSIVVPAGIYSGTVTVKNEMGCVGPGISFSINAIPAPSISTTGTIDSLCGSKTNQRYANLPYSATTGNPTSYSIDWNADANAALLVDQASTLFAFSSSGGIINTIDIPANVPVGTYSGRLTIIRGTCSRDIDVNITITPQAVGGTVTGGTTIASGSTSGLLTLSGHTGTVVSWYSSVSPFTDWVSIGNFNNTTYTSGPLTETTKFNARVESGNCFFTVNSESTTVTVADPPTITTASTTTVCLQDSSSAPATSVPLPYSATTGSPVTYSIVWDSSPANNLVAVTDAALAASPIFIAIPAGTSFETFTGTITVKDANGISSSGSPFSVKITTKPSITTTGELITTCSYDHFQYAKLDYSASTGNPTSYSVDWDDEAITDQPNFQFSFASSGGQLIIPIPANTPAGIYSGTMHLFNDASCSESLPVSLTIIPQIVGGAVTGGTTIASGSTSGLLTLSGHTGSVAMWQSSVSPFTSWIDIANTNTTYTSGPLTETTQFRAYVQNGICSAVYSESTTVTVEDLPTIALAASAQDICSDGSITSTPLFYKGTTGSPETYSIVWNSSPANSFVAVTDATLPPNLIKIVVPAGTVAGTYTGTLTVKDANGVSSIGSSFSVTIGVIPEISLASDADSVCASTSLQTTQIYYRDVTGNPTSYSINWSQEANDALLQDQANTPNVFDEVEGYIQTIQISANAQAGTYSGTLIISNDSCSQSLDISITINPSTTAPVIGDIIQPTPESPTGSVVLTGLPSGFNIITRNPGGISSPASGESFIYANLAPGEYTFTVTDENGVCQSLESESVVINNPTSFKGVSSKPTIGTGDLESLKNPIVVSAFNKVINVETPNQIIDKVYIFNVSGSLLYEKAGVSDSKLVIGDLRSSNQVLVVKVVLNNNQSETRKIIF